MKQTTKKDSIKTERIQKTKRELNSRVEDTVSKVDNKDKYKIERR